MNNKLNSNIKKLYDKINNDSHFVIFGISNCKFCKETIKLLTNKNIKYKYYLIDDYFEIFFEILNNLSIKYKNLKIDTKHKTVPVIFFSNKFIGGYTNLKKILDN